MSFVYDELPNRGRIRGTWNGRITSNPGDLNERVRVTIDAFHPGLNFGPCRWQSRDAVSLPTRGDACLVVFDDATAEPWVVAWWPFGT